MLCHAMFQLPHYVDYIDLYLLYYKLIRLIPYIVSCDYGALP